MGEGTINTEAFGMLCAIDAAEKNEVEMTLKLTNGHKYLIRVNRVMDKADRSDFTAGAVQFREVTTEQARKDG